MKYISEAECSKEEADDATLMRWQWSSGSCVLGTAGLMWLTFQCSGAQHVTAHCGGAWDQWQDKCTFGLLTYAGAQRSTSAVAFDFSSASDEQNEGFAGLQS